MAWNNDTKTYSFKSESVQINEETVEIVQTETVPTSVTITLPIEVAQAVALRLGNPKRVTNNEVFPAFHVLYQALCYADLDPYTRKDLLNG